MRAPGASRFLHLLTLILVTSGLLGCQPLWVKPGEADHEFKATAAGCIEFTRHAFFTRGYSGSDDRQAYLNRCIASHGYRQIDPHDVPGGIQGHPFIGPYDAYVVSHMTD